VDATWLINSIIASPGSLFVADSYEDLADSYDLGDDAYFVANPLTSRKPTAIGDKLSLPQSLTCEDLYSLINLSSG
jgi:hypothetical protein